MISAEKICATAPTPHSRVNNFGPIRLILACSVILAHSPEILDGTRAREPLSRLFGTISLGDLAVDGFFLVSGFLIAKSLLSTRTIWEYILKRLLRIYPGFLVSFGVCIAFIAPLAGRPWASLHVSDALNLARAAISLKEPVLGGIFPHLHYHNLDAPMWTIAYEFKCYLLLALFGVLGVIRRRVLFLCVTLVLWLGFATYTGTKGALLLRFSTLFCVGSVFYLFRDRISLNRAVAAGCACAMIPFLFSDRLCQPAVAVFGAYTLFWVALRAPTLAVLRFTDRTDISYGIYLYAWPIQSLLAVTFPLLSPWVLFGLALVPSVGLGWISWVLIERPFVRLKQRSRSPTSLPSVTGSPGPLKS